MKNLKKVIALVAVFALVFTTVTAFASSFVDVEDSANYTEAVEALNKLGIITGDTNENGEATYRPDDSVTRAEMAALVSRIQGFNASSQAATPFADVPTTHWASGYIAAAAQTGIVNGYGDGNFGPEDPVLYEQVIKMVMVTLGYEPFAAANGGYPTGYTIAASRYDVTKDVTGGVAGQPAPRATIAQILYNAIDTPLMQQYYYGAGSENYVIYDGTNGFAYKTLLSQNLKVTKLRGQLTSNGITTLTGAENIDTDEDNTVVVKINGTYNTDNVDYAYINTDVGEERTFLSGDSGIEKYIGQQIVLYVKSDDTLSYPLVISAAPESGRNKTESFTVDKFDRLEEGNNVVRYYKNDTDRTSTRITVQDDYSLIYNNAGGYTLEDVFGAEGLGVPVEKNSKVGGKVTFYDTDTVSGYDVIVVEVAATAVVDTVDGNMVSFKNSQVGDSIYHNLVTNLTVDEDDSSQIVNIVKDGKEIAYTDLAEWDVLSIIYNNDSKELEDYYDIRVISNTVEGSVATVSASDTSANGSKYRIGDGTYDVAIGAYEADNLSAGDAGLFYIDEYGKIAAYNQDYSASVGSGNYAYIIQAIDNTDDFNTKALTLKILTTKDGVKTWNVAPNNLTIRNYDDSSLAKSIFGSSRYKVKDDDDLTGTAAALTGQVIKYSTNSASQISSIELVCDNDDNSSHLSQMYHYDSVTYDADDSRFVGSGNTPKKIFVGENAIVFFVNDTDADSAEVGTIAEIADNADYTNVDLYDEENEGPSLIVINDEHASNGISTSSSAIVIDSVGTTTNSEGTIVDTISYYQDGTLKNANASENIDGDLASFNQGDMALISLNASGEIKGITPLVTFDPDYVRNDAAAEFPTGDIEKPMPSRNEVHEGAAVKKNGSRVTLVGQDGNEEGSYNLSGANVYVYDVSKARNNLTVGSTGSILINSSLLNNSEWGNKKDTEYTVYTSDGVDLGVTPAFALCDYVYVRTYDDDVIDVLVIKAPDFGTLRFR